MTIQVSGARSQVSRSFVFGSVGWRESSVLLVVAWLVPFLVHALPWAGPRPLGVYLLPVFWTTFIAVYLYGALPGLVTGLVAPLINLAFTGLPALRSTGLVSLELVLFVSVAALMVARWPGFWPAAPLAWLAAKAGAIAVQFLIPAFQYTGHPVQHWLRSTENALAGLAVLAVIHFLLVRFYPKGDDWENE